MKTTKILVLALALCLAFTSLTAFAAKDINVTTITNYDYDAADTDLMTVTATVSGVAVDDMITYYVSKGNEIVYIDQITADATSFDFQFKATKGAVIGATAKNGANKDYAFPTFTFAAGCNYLTQGSVDAEKVSDPISANTLELVDDVQTELTGYAITGKVSGPAVEYGVKLDGIEYPAYGCDEKGNFIVVLEGIDEATARKADVYAK